MTDEHQDPIEPIEPIDPELARLLRSGAPALVAPAGASERLLGKLSVSIPGLGGGPGGGGGGGGGATAGATTAATKAIALIAAAVAVGGIAIGVASRTTSSPPTTMTTTTTAAPSSATTSAQHASSNIPTVSIDSLPSAAASATLEKRAVPRASASTASASPSPSSTGTPAPVGDVVEERRLVDGARAALARGDAAAAMTIIAEHEQRFPNGVLVEEREAIAIRTLVAQKRTPEAEARAARFRSAHPTSLFLPSVDAAFRLKDQ